MQNQPEEEEIFKILHMIFENIGVEGEIERFEELTDPELYLQIFDIMFPFLNEKT